MDPIIKWKITIIPARQGWSFNVSGTWIGEPLTDEVLTYDSTTSKDEGQNYFAEAGWAAISARQKAEDWTNEIRRCSNATDIVEEYEL